VLRRAAGEGGFTLVELLVGMSMGMIVLFSLLTLLDQGAPAARRVGDRADADGRGRLALEQITQDLHSLVCVSNGVVAAGAPAFRTPIESASGQQITFFAAPTTPTATAQGTFTPERRQLIYAAGRIAENRWAATGTPATFPTLTATRTVLTDVRPTTAGGPIFAIYAHDPTTGALVATTDPTKVSAVGVSFAVDPSGAAVAGPQAATFDDTVALGLPTDFTSYTTAANGPKCSL
jgi:hypothetical protein